MPDGTVPLTLSVVVMGSIFRPDTSGEVVRKRRDGLSNFPHGPAVRHNRLKGLMVNQASASSGGGRKGDGVGVGGGGGRRKGGRFNPSPSNVKTGYLVAVLTDTLVLLPQR